ncbi:MAG: DUF4185 domain-containing protein [Gemmatimonadaceae bacterium]
MTMSCCPIRHGAPARAGLLALLTLAAACAPDPTQPTARDPGVDQAIVVTGAPPIPAIQSVVDVGTIVQNPVIYGRDGNFSGRIGNRSVWTFGDTPLSAPNANGLNWDDNTLSWTKDLNAADGITLTNDITDASGNPGEFMPYTAFETQYNYDHDSRHCTAQPCGAEYAMWPSAVVADPARARALIFYGEIWRIAGQSTWTNIGGGIAVGTGTGTFTRPILNPGNPDPTLMWDSTEVQFTGGAATKGDTLFSFGCTAGILNMHCRIGRVLLADALVKSAWEYHHSDGSWSNNATTADTVFLGGAAANTIVYSPYLKLWVLFYSRVFSDDVLMRVAYDPWGPWSGWRKVFTARPGWNGNTSYAAQPHVEYAQQNGKVQYVTYAHTIGFLRMDQPIAQISFR